MFSKITIRTLQIKNIMKNQLYTNTSKNYRWLWVCSIWMIYLELNRFFYDPSRKLQLSEFVWTLRSSVWDVLKKFLLIDAIDITKIRSNHHQLFLTVSLHPLSFFANTPFNNTNVFTSVHVILKINSEICSNRQY